MKVSTELNIPFYISWKNVEVSSNQSSRPSLLQLSLGTGTKDLVSANPDTELCVFLPLNLPSAVCICVWCPFETGPINAGYKSFPVPQMPGSSSWQLLNMPVYEKI